MTNKTPADVNSAFYLLQQSVMTKLPEEESMVRSAPRRNGKACQAGHSES